jgi:hypothetical protein
MASSRLGAAPKLPAGPPAVSTVCTAGASRAMSASLSCSDRAGTCTIRRATITPISMDAAIPTRASMSGSSWYAGRMSCTRRAWMNSLSWAAACSWVMAARSIASSGSLCCGSPSNSRR